MWNTIAFVAKTMRVDAAALKAFALANGDKYNIVTDSGEPEVNTWHVDKLLDDFRARPVCTCSRGPHMYGLWNFISVYGGIILATALFFFPFFAEAIL